MANKEDDQVDKTVDFIFKLVSPYIESKETSEVFLNQCDQSNVKTARPLSDGFVAFIRENNLVGDKKKVMVMATKYLKGFGTEIGMACLVLSWMELYMKDT